MNKTRLGSLAVLAGVLLNAASTVAIACTLDGKEGIAPQNDLYIPVTSFANFSSLSEKAFRDINTKMTKLYQPVLAAQGRSYRVVADWGNGEVNAYAMRNGKVSEVYMFGGLARHPNMTPDGYVLVICHETGHHLGGSPVSILSSGKANPDMANEGQADYYATFACARKIWANDNNAAVVAAMRIPAEVERGCQKSFKSPAQVALCERSAMAGRDLGATLADLNRTPIPDFGTPDTRVAPNSKYPNWDNADPDMRLEPHPPAQCRLDTYFAGATCGKKAVDVLSAKDPLFAVCTQEKGDHAGVRPVCWYKPGKPSAPGKTDVPPSREQGSSRPSIRLGFRS